MEQATSPHLDNRNRVTPLDNRCSCITAGFRSRGNTVAIGADTESVSRTIVLNCVHVGFVQSAPFNDGKNGGAVACLKYAIKGGNVGGW